MIRANDLRIQNKSIYDEDGSLVFPLYEIGIYRTSKKDIYEMWEYIMKCVDKYEEDKANEEDETND